MVTTTTKMSRTVSTTACLAPGQQDCRWDISYRRLKGIISSWRGTQDQAASLTSKISYECISVSKLYLHLNFFFLSPPRYPRHRKLISINKVNTGRRNSEFNLRHDWNSLLSDKSELLFKRVNGEFYPPADSIILYLKMFEKELGLKVRYGVDIGQIKGIQSQAGRSYVLIDQHASEYTCRYFEKKNVTFG